MQQIEYYEEVGSTPAEKIYFFRILIAIVSLCVHLFKFE
jgi:hypothetical protein